MNYLLLLFGNSLIVKSTISSLILLPYIYAKAEGCFTKFFDESFTNNEKKNLRMLRFYQHALLLLRPTM
jgi:hypothetical protein